MKKIILILLGLIVLAVAGLSIYISLLDWNAHKGRIAMQFSSVVGENIVFGGDLKVSLLPHPKMSAKSVSVVNPQTGETLATIGQLNMAVTLSSVLHGTPDIQSLSVDNVELWLKFDENGKSNWTRQVAPQQSALNDVRVQIVYVRDSVVHIQNKTYGLAVDLTDFAAEIQAEFLDSGPYQIAGNFIYENERYGLALGIDSMRQLDDVGFHLGLRHPSTEGKFVYDGVFNKQTGMIKGSFSGEFTQTAEIINKLTQTEILGDKYNIPMQFSAKDMNLEDDKVNISGLTIKMDPYFVGTGNLAFSRHFIGDNPKTFDVKYQIVDMDVRSIIKQLQDKFWQYPQEVYLPDNTWSGNFDVTVGRLRVSDNDAGYLANAGAKGSWQHNTLQIDDFYADGQGDVDLTFSGSVAPQNDMPEIMMVLGLQGEDIKTFFQTLNVELKAPVSNAYQKARLEAEVKLNPKELLIDNARLKLGNADISGRLNAVFAQKKYLLNVDTNNLNFDTYIFPLNKDETGDVIAILRHDAQKVAEYRDYNTEVVLHAMNSTFRGVMLKDVVLNATYENAELTVEKLSLKEFIGTSIEAAGVFKHLDADMPDIETLSFSAQSQNLRGLADKLGIPLPEWTLFGQKDISVTSTLSGNYNQVQTKTELVSDGDVLSYDGLLTKADGRLLFDGIAELKTPKLENLLSKVNLNLKDYKVLRGVFNASSRIKGGVNDYELTDANFKIGATNYTGNVKVTKPGDKYSVIGDINVSELNLAQFLGTQKVSARNVPLKSDNTFLARPNFGKATFDFSPYNKVDFDIKLSADKGFYDNFSMSDFKAKVGNAAQQLSIKDAEFKVGTINVNGDAVVEYSQTPHVSGNISVDKWPIKKVGGSIYAISAGNVNLTGNYDGSLASFEDLFASLSGKLTVRTQEVLIYGIDLGAIADDLQVREYSKGLFQVGQKYLQRGSTKFVPMELNIPIQNGVIAFNGIDLQNSDASAALNGKVNLRDWRITADMRVKYKSLPKIEPYKFSLTGALNNPVLDVSVENIARKYDEHWQQVADTEKARKDEAERILNEHMTKAQLEVSELAERHTAAMALIDRYNGHNLAPETTQLYFEQSRRLDEIGRIIQNMQNKAQQQKFTDNDVDDIKKQTAELRAEVESISQKINEYFADDLVQAMADVREKVVQIQSQYDSVYEDFNQMTADDEKQLKMINAEQYMTNDTIFLQYKAGMENYQNAVTQQAREFYEKYQSIQEMPAGSDKLAAIHSLSAIPASLEEKYKQMQEIHKATAALLLNIINQQQEAYQAEQLAKEKKRQKEAAENAGNLLIENPSYDYATDDSQANNGGNMAQDAEVESGVVKRIITPEDYRTLLPLQDDQNVPAQGGILIRSGDGRELYVAPEKPSKLLTPIEDEKPETGGYIIVR